MGQLKYIIKMNKIKKLSEEISKLNIEESIILVNNLENRWKINNNKNYFIKKEENIKTVTNKPLKYTIILNSIGNKKLNIIKEIKKITGKNLMESKKMIDKLPAT